MPFASPPFILIYSFINRMIMSLADTLNWTILGNLACCHIILRSLFWLWISVHFQNGNRNMIFLFLKLHINIKKSFHFCSFFRISVLPAKIFVLCQLTRKKKYVYKFQDRFINFAFLFFLRKSLREYLQLHIPHHQELSYHSAAHLRNVYK